MTKLSIYADSTFGKVSENILRRIVTGKGVESLPSSDGLYLQAKKHAPTPSEIKNVMRKLVVAYDKKGGSKQLVKLNRKTREEILKKRLKAIGWTARTLLYSWREAFNGRSAKVTGRFTKRNQVVINSKGDKATATFTSTSKGLAKLDKKHNLVAKEIRKAKQDAVPYIQQIITKEIRDMFR